MTKTDKAEKQETKKAEPLTTRARKMLEAMWGAKIASQAAQDAALEGADETGQIAQRYITVANESELTLRATRQAMMDLEGQVREEEHEAARLPIVQMQDRVQHLQGVITQAQHEIENGDITEADAWAVRENRAGVQIASLTRRAEQLELALKEEFFAESRHWKLGYWNQCGEILTQRPWAIEPLSAGFAFAQFADTFSEQVVAEGVRQVSSGHADLDWCELSIEQIMMPAMGKNVQYQEKDTEGMRLEERDGIRTSYLETRLWIRTQAVPCQPHKTGHGSSYGERHNFAVLLRRNTDRPNTLPDRFDTAREDTALRTGREPWRGYGAKAAGQIPSKY